MEPFSSFFLYAIYFLLFIFLLRTLFQIPHSRIWSISAGIIGLAGALIQVLLEYYILRFYSYHLIAGSMFFIYLVIVCVLFRKQLIFGLYYACLSSVLTPSFSFICSNIESLLDFSHHQSIWIISLSGLLLLSYLWIIHSSKNYPFDFPLPFGYRLMMYASCLLEYYCLIKINDLLTFHGLVTISTIMVEIGFFIIILLIYRLIIQMCRSYQKSVQEQATAQQLMLREMNYEENQEVYEQMRTLRHELKNHIFYMDYLLDQKKYQELHTYFLDFYEKEYADYGYWDTSSSPVSTLLNLKQRMAAKKGISMTVSASLPEKNGIRDVDLCTILSNLLDNALENCPSEKNASIQVIMEQKKEYLSLTVKNTVQEDILSHNPSLLTTKSNRQLHGIGLSVVRYLVKQYEGMIDFSTNDGYFTVSILLLATAAESGQNTQ